jgi:hypothetical protein
MRPILTFAVLFSSAAIFAHPSSALRVQASRGERRPCNVSQLPSEIQTRISTDFRAWEVQSTENLNHAARLRWEGEQSSGCPGIAKGSFKDSTQTSYAVVLVRSDRRDSAYKLVVFSHQKGSSAYEESIVEKSDRGGSDFFIRQVPVAKFFNETSKKKFHVHATEAILMIDSAENEYEADIYFWSDGCFHQEPVDY